MRRLLCIILSAVMLVSVLATVSFAKTADIVHQSVEGTAVVDGVKDEAYENALALPMNQKGLSNGSGKKLETPMATVYILNDAEWIYVFFEVTDNQLDSSNPNNWEQDSVEVYYMDKNVGKQVRYLLDATAICNYEHATEAVIVPTDIGYNAEVKMPITDVLDNKAEICVQINQCTDGIRDYTVFIEDHRNGDEAWQRSSRESEFDAWWTLVLAGQHDDTLEVASRDPLELTTETWAQHRNTSMSVYLSSQNRVDYSDYAIIGDYLYPTLGAPVEAAWSDLALKMNYTDATTLNYTVAPMFNLVITDNGKISVGESGWYQFSYSDIVIKAEGYEDVVVEGKEISKVFKPFDNGTYVDGNSTSIDLVTAIKVALDLDVQGVCEYLTKVTDVSCTVSVLAYEGVTAEEFKTYEETVINVEDDKLYTELQPLSYKVADAEALFADETATLEALGAALQEAEAAASKVTAEAKGLPKTTELGADLTARVEALKALYETKGGYAVTEPPVTEPPVTEPPVTDAPVTEAPEVDEPTVVPETNGSLTTVLMIAAAVAVVAVVVVVILVSKKKK